MLLAYRAALASPHVHAAAIEATEFPQLADEMGVYAVPAVVIDGEQRYAGAVPERVFVERLLAAAGLVRLEHVPRGRIDRLARRAESVGRMARLGRYKLWIVVAIVLFVIGVVLPLSCSTAPEAARIGTGTGPSPSRPCLN